jgi:hypothetical protein
MRNLLTAARRAARTARRAVLSVAAPSQLFETATVAAPEPVDLYTEDDMPDAELIEAAAREYDRAADLARRADRGKRAARKILDRLPAGTYSGWLLERVPSSRATVDLNEVRRLFKAHGLGPVPMKAAAPSLKVRRAETPAAELLAA